MKMSQGARSYLILDHHLLEVNVTAYDGVTLTSAMNVNLMLMSWQTAATLSFITYLLSLCVMSMQNCDLTYDL